MNKLVFIFLISLAVVPSLLNADTIFFKDGMRLDVEKVWEENNQIKYILYGSTISVPMEKIERIEKSKEDKKEQKSDTTKQMIRKGRAEKNLGFQSYSLGSQGQAEALLNLINNDQGKADYQISYKTDSDTVVFGCNFEKDVIIRIHQHSDGHGSQEMWSGYIMHRLKNSDSGGSLNDTPVGKKVGIYQRF